MAAALKQLLDTNRRSKYHTFGNIDDAKKALRVQWFFSDFEGSDRRFHYSKGKLSKIDKKRS